MNMDQVRQPFVRDDQEDGAIWLDVTNVDRYSGLCLAVGVTLTERIADARSTLQLIASQLDELEAGTHRRSEARA